MENDKFQELVIKQFGEIQSQFGQIQNQFGEINNQFGQIQNQFGKVFKQLDRLEVFAKQHHEELELVARQIETHEIKDISKSKFYLVKVPE
jgi:archaellum component FlaC